MRFEKFIAVSPKGKEFMYSRERIIAVPKNSAQKIATILNENKYKLKDGEVWHVHDNDSYTDQFIGQCIKKCTGKKMIVYRYCGGML